MSLTFSSSQLKHLMGQRRLTPQELAARVGVSYPTVWRWLADQSVPSVAVIALADALGVDPHELVTDDEAPAELS